MTKLSFNWKHSIALAAVAMTTPSSRIVTDSGALLSEEDTLVQSKHQQLWCEALSGVVREDKIDCVRVVTDYSSDNAFTITLW